MRDTGSNTRYLLAILALMGAVLAVGAVFAATVPAEEVPRAAKQAPVQTPVPCPEAFPAASTRDAEAQALVENLDEALDAAREVAGRDVHLYPISSFPEATFRLFYIGKDKPVARVDLDSSGRVVHAEAVSNSSMSGFGAMKSIDDVRIGPSATIAAARERTPEAEFLVASLWRIGDCSLAWRVFIRTAQRFFTISIDNATGEVNERDGPPDGFSGPGSVR